MTETLTQLVGRINLPSGETPENGKISFSLADWDKAGIDIFVPGPVSFELTADGDLIDCLLQSTAANDREQVYLPIVTYWSRLTNRLVSVGFPPIALPSVGPVNFADLLQIPVTVPVAPDVLAQAIAAAVAAQGAAAAAAGSAAAAAGSAGSAASNAGDADTARIAAQLAQADAEAARDASFINADIYTTLAAGRASVADGEQFNLLINLEIVRYIRTSSTTQTEIARFPMTPFVSGQMSARTFYADTTAFLAATTSGQFGYIGTQQYKNLGGAAFAVARDELGYIRERLSKIVMATSVAGTGAAYTASALDDTWADDIDHFLIFTPHLTNTVGSPTLSVNGGPAYPIGDSGLDALEVGRLTAGYPFILYRTAAGAWRLLTDKWIKQRIFDEETNRALQIAARTFYADTTAFLAATTSGQHGYVGSQQYKNNAGAALAVTRDELGYIRDRLGKVVIATSVAGTGAAYTASALDGTWADDVDHLLIFTPHLTNTVGSPTLSVNGGPAYPIGESGPDALDVGRLTAGYPFILYRTAAGAWRLLTDKWIKQRILDEETNRALQIGSSLVLASVGGTGAAYTATSTNTTADAVNKIVVFVPHVDNTIGAPTLQINGGAVRAIGESGPDALGLRRLIAGYPYLMKRESTGAWRLLTDKWVKNRLDIGDVAVDNSAHVARITAIHQAQQSNPLSEGSRLNDVTYVAGAGVMVWHASPAPAREIASSGKFVDLTWMQSGDAKQVAISAYGAGDSTLITPGGNHLLVSGSRVLVSRDYAGAYHFQTTAGTLTLGAGAATPVYDMTFIVGGQSLADRFINGGGLYGLQRGWRDYAGVDTQKFWAINGATGASGLVPASQPDRYWWDPVLDVPGPCAVTWKAALDAKPVAQPDPAAIIWIFGQTDAGWIGTDPTLSSAAYKATLLKLFQWMQDQISLVVDTPIILCPLGAFDGITNESKVMGVRSCELDLINEEASIHLGPSYFDLSRGWSDVHLTEEVTSILGYRLAPILDNVVNAAAHETGPTVIGITELSAGLAYKLRIQWQTGYDFTRPLDPEGFAVFAAGADYLTDSPLAIASKSWAYVSNIVYDLTITLTAASAGASVVFPHGTCSWMRRGRWPMNAVAAPNGLGFGNILPLQPFKSGAF